MRSRIGNISVADRRTVCPVCGGHVLMFLSGQHVEHILPGIAQGLHGREQQIGSCIPKHLIGERSGIDRNGEDVG